MPEQRVTQCRDQETPMHLHKFKVKLKQETLAEGPREALVSRNPATTKHLT